MPEKNIQILLYSENLQCSLLFHPNANPFQSEEMVTPFLSAKPKFHKKDEPHTEQRTRRFEIIPTALRPTAL